MALAPKIFLIYHSVHLGLPVVSSMGSGAGTSAPITGASSGTAIPDAALPAVRVFNRFIPRSNDYFGSAIDPVSYTHL